jgi:hypothetical protein
MSYLPPKHWFWRLFTPFWRCQNKTIEEQIDAGVRFFDLRVVWDRKLHWWQFAHGLVRFGGTVSVEGVIALLEMHKCLYRIVLECGTEYDEVLFRYGFVHAKYIEAWWGNHPHCIAAIIKRGWRSIRSRRFDYAYKNMQLADHSFVPFHSDRPWWKQLSWKMFCTPRLWAKRHNTVQQGWEEDRDTVHLYDFATEMGRCGRINR